ncbi:MAG: hypothetical protein IT196_15135 [Acidimicrobiales bacterium]|nr:hypothetical protein [Acidimicrobiales bacterium]
MALARRRERRAEQQERPFPSAGRRIRSAVGLVVLVGVLGCLLAALVGAVLAAVVIVGNHLVG